ncbi:hypothetical protein AAMO2058_000810800 [Amorphochlora amoebiformis]
MAEESIYNLIPKVQPPQKKPPRYKSKFSSAEVPPSYSTFGRSVGSQAKVTNVAGEYYPQNPSHGFKYDGATFGKTQKHISDPKNFTKKKPFEPPQGDAFHYNDRVKAKLDTKLDKSKIPKREKKNFIQKNAVETILKGITIANMPFLQAHFLLVPKLMLILSIPVNHCRNNVVIVSIFTAKKSPERRDIRYVHKPDYGKVPEYLDSVKAEVQAEKDYVENYIARQQARLNINSVHVLDDQQRVELLEKLKLKWAEVNQKYQKIAHVVKLDTAGKVRRKEQYEAELDEMEQAIEKLGRRTVLIAEDY